MVGTLRCVTWVLCALVLSVPSVSAEDDEPIVSVAPGDESCTWITVMPHPEPLFVRYQTDPACAPGPPFLHEIIRTVEDLIQSLRETVPAPVVVVNLP